MKERGTDGPSPETAPETPACWCARLGNPFPGMQTGPENAMNSVIFLIWLHHMTSDETVTPLMRFRVVRPSHSRLWRS